jgi:GntR family transcriptional regulator
MRKAPRTLAYQRVAEDLRTFLRSPKHHKGWQLPTEAELAARHGVSRHTVRRAYQDLVADGLVTRTAGRGTFVLPPAPYLRSFGSIEDLIALSVDTELEIVEPLGIVKDEVASNLLGQDSPTTYSVSFLRLHGSSVLGFTTVHLPEAIGVKLQRVKSLTRSGARSQNTILGLLDRVHNATILGAKQTITPALATRHIAELIECAVGQPILQINRLYVDENGKAVELATSWFNPERYVYRLEIRRARS